MIAFAVPVIRATEALPKTQTGNHIRNQLLRSGTSPAPNYGEAQRAESRTDFTHKLKIVLKELWETLVRLLMIQQAGLIRPVTVLDALAQDTNELISIFVASLKTTEKRRG